MNPYSIALVITQSSWGGAQRYVFDLAVSFKKLGHRVVVVAGRNRDPLLFERLKEEEIETINVGSLIREINPLTDIYCIYKLFKLFKLHKFDVVHLNSSKAGVVGSIAARLARVPCVIYTAHGFVFNEKLSALKRWMYIFVELASSFFRDAIITVSTFDERSALRLHIAPKWKMRTIWNGIDVTHDSYTSRVDARTYLLSSQEVPDDRYMIGCVANFYANKGLEHLLQAMELLIKQNPKAFLVVIGDGILRPELEESIQSLKLTQNVLLVGYKKDPEKHLKAFDLLVSSSLKEGLSYTLIEAARAKVPIIATAVGGTPEIIHDHVHGLLVPPGDPHTLADMLSFAISHPKEMTQYATAAHERVTRDFDVEQMVQKTLGAYDEYAERKH